MGSDGQYGGPDMERFRSYLNLMARLHLGRRLWAKVSPSDVVQVTLAEAYSRRDRFEGRAFGQQVALLRKMLASNLAKTGRDLRRQKRDIGRERSLEAAMESSSVRLVAVLAAEESSPSEKAIRNERILILADALEELPGDQREAVLLHYIEGLSTREIGERLGRTPTSVSGLLRRGLKRLRELVGTGG